MIGVILSGLLGGLFGWYLASIGHTFTTPEFWVIWVFTIAIGLCWVNV